MAAPYRPPSWAGPPPPTSSTKNWSVEEIKGGTLIATHPLHGRACTTFGRAADAVDVPTSHESCSRLHARIAFDPGGGGRGGLTVWLRDLGSTHGTRVNGRRIPPMACGRNEDGRGDGSRGVVVNPGDVIRFGESTREFRLVGPSRPEQEYGRAAAVVARSSNPTEQTEEADGDDRGGGGISWGIDTDDHPDEEEEDRNGPGSSSSSLPPLTSDSVPERHRKTYERMRAKEYKLANLQRESERIEGKGYGAELTDGQTAQLERNRGRIATLTEEISALEDEIRCSMGDAASSGGNVGETGGKIRRRKRRGAEHHDEEEEDDFFDRRNRETERFEGRPGGGAETEESLRRRWKSLVSSLRGSDAEAGATASRVRQLKERLATADDDDAYFVRNDLDLAEEASRKVADKRSEAENVLADVEKMLRVASNDELVLDREKGTVMTLRQQQEAMASEAMPPPPSPSSASTSMRASPATKSDISTGSRAGPAGPSAPNTPAPPPSHTPADRRVAPSSSVTKGGAGGGVTVVDTSTMPPPPPMKPTTAPTNAGAGKRRVLGPSAMPPPAPVTVAKGVERAAAASTAEATTTGKHRRRQVGPAAPPPGSTASFLSAPGGNDDERGGTLSDGRSSGRNRVGEGGGGGGSAEGKTAATDGRHVVPGTSSSASASDRSTDVGRKDEWRAPKDQDGSGVTKLNAKFAGRY